MSDSSLNSFDRNLASTCQFTILAYTPQTTIPSTIQGEEGTIGGGGITITFQFPPKFTNESNSSEWEVTDVWAIEPLKIHRGSGGRKISMEWEYIATDATWTAAYIANQIRNLKAYFFQFAKEIYPVVEIQYTQIIPVPTQFRLMDMQITYGPEMVQNPVGVYHPIYTKVAINLELATTINDFEAGSVVEKSTEKPLQDAIFDWY